MDEEVLDNEFKEAGTYKVRFHGNLNGYISMCRRLSKEHKDIAEAFRMCSMQPGLSADCRRELMYNHMFELGQADAWDDLKRAIENAIPIEE